MTALSFHAERNTVESIFKLYLTAGLRTLFAVNAYACILNIENNDFLICLDGFYEKLNKACLSVCCCGCGWYLRLLKFVFSICSDSINKTNDSELNVGMGKLNLGKHSLHHMIG